MKAFLIDSGFRTLNVFHRAVLSVTRGRYGHVAAGMTVVELRTTGRRSGVERRTLLTVPVVEGECYVLVASKGGDDRDPDWYRNVVATAAVELVVRGESKPMLAHSASEKERAILWPKVVATYRPYASYQRRSSREIPLVICEPR